jgi:hypothetical protein
MFDLWIPHKRALDIVFMDQPGYEPRMVSCSIVVIGRLNRESNCSVDRNPKYDTANEQIELGRPVFLPQRLATTTAMTVPTME